MRRRNSPNRAMTSLPFARCSPKLSFMPSPWVVTSLGCRCTIICFATDPQTEHMNPEEGPPQSSALVTCSCCWATFRYAGKQIARGTPTQNPQCASRRGKDSKTDGAVLVAASVVAAIRLRGLDMKPSPKLTATIKDSVELARRILAEVQALSGNLSAQSAQQIEAPIT